MVGEAFAADLLGTAAFAHRMDQLDPIGVDDAEHGRSRQEDLCPVLMRLEEAKEAGARREGRGPTPEVFCPPTQERAGCPPPFLGVEPPHIPPTPPEAGRRGVAGGLP